MNNRKNSNFSLRKLLITALVAGPLAVLPAPLWALPSTASTNLTMTSGVSISSSSSTAINFTASADKQVLTWVDFGGGAQTILAGDTINYTVPASGSILNYVSGTNSTTISGTIASNGSVYVLNKNGIAINNGAVINTGGFVASTIDDALAAANFQLTGNLQLNGAGTNAVTVGQTGSSLAAPQFQAIGSGNNITLVGNGVNVNSGAFYGNLTLKSIGATASTTPAAITLTANNTAGTGAVSVNQISSPAVGGKLTINSNGANITLSQPGTTATSGAAVLAGGGVTSVASVGAPGAVGSGYTPNSSSIAVTFGAAPSGGVRATGVATTDAQGRITGVNVINAGSGYTTAPSVTIAAPTANTLTVANGMALDTTNASSAAAGNVSQNSSNAISVTGTSTITTSTATTTTPGTITLGNAALNTLAIPSAGATTVTTSGSNALVLGNVNITATQVGDNLTLNSSASGDLSSSSGTSIVVNPTATFASPTVSLTGRNQIATVNASGAMTFSTIASNTTATITSNGNITLTGQPSTRNLSITTSNGTISATTFSSNSTTRLGATGDITTTGNIAATVANITSSAGKITLGGSLTTSGASTVSAPGDISIASTISANTGGLTITSSGGQVFNPTTIATSVSAGSSSATSVTIQAATNINLTGTFTNNAGVTLTATGGTLTVGTLSSTSTATVALTALNDIALAGGTVPVLSVTSTGGRITQTGAITSTSKATFNALNDILLDSVTTNDFNVVVLQGAGGGSTGASVKDKNDITIGGGTNVKGATTITGGAGITAAAAGTANTTSTATATAVGTATIDTAGKISGVSISNNGASYAPNQNNIVVTIGAPTVTNAVLATPTVSGTGTITAIAITSAGQGYPPNTNIPLTITDGTGTGATAYAAVGKDGRILNVVMTNVGSGYSATPSVTAGSYAAPAGSTASVVASTDSTGKISGVTVIDGGNGYTPFSNATTTTAATGTATFTAPAGSTQATITRVLSAAGAITGATVTVAGSNLTSPTLDLGNGSTATLTLNPINNSVASVSVSHSGGVTLGTQASDSLFFGGNLTITATGPSGTNSTTVTPYSTISTLANSIYSFGATSLNTGGANATLGAANAGNAGNYSFGAVSANVGTGTVTINENQPLNLGAITAGTLNANSLSSIVNNGSAAAIVVPTVALSAGSIFSPGNITLSNTGNQITTLNLVNANNVDITTGSAGTGTTVTAGSTTQNGNAVLGSLKVTELNNKNLRIDSAGAGSFNNVGFSATGNVVVKAPGNITLQNATNTTAAPAASAAGAFVVDQAYTITTVGTTDYTLIGAANNTIGTTFVATGVGAGTGTATGSVVTVSAPGAISLGSGIALNGGGALTLNATGGNGRIVDTSPNVFVGGPATLISANDISITKAGHSFGPVSLISGAAGGTPSSSDITYTEGGSANLNIVKVNSGGGTVDGTLKVVSTGGSIIQTNTGTAATSGFISVPSINGANTATFLAAGGVSLSNPNNTAAALGNNIAVPIALTAATDSSVLQGSGTIGTNVRLANVAVTGGGLIVDTSGSATATLSQTTGSTIFSYGITGLKTGGGALTVANDGNNFGAISIATAGGAASIKESGTMNLASVVTGAGKFTANAGVGIIQTSNVATFGVTAAVAGMNVGGANSLTAGANGITLNGSNTSLGAGGVTLNTAGNVNISDAAATTTLGTTTNIGGTLRVTNTNAGPGASITDGGVGNITVGGSVQLELVNGNISISGPNNSFGAVGFRANTVALSENTTLNLAGSSVAYGSVTLSSNGDIITSGLGPLTFSGAATSLTLSAGGNITISNAATFVSNGLTFLARGAVDLSALSLIGNLNGKTPTNLGAASYKAPAP